MIGHVSPLFLGRRDLSTYENGFALRSRPFGSRVARCSTAAGPSGVEPSFGGNDAERAEPRSAALREQKDNGCVRTDSMQEAGAGGCRYRGPAVLRGGEMRQAGGDVGKPATSTGRRWTDARKNWGRATRAQNALIIGSPPSTSPLVDAVRCSRRSRPPAFSETSCSSMASTSLMGQILIASAFAEAVARLRRPDRTTIRDGATPCRRSTSRWATNARGVLSAGWLV